MGRWAGFLFLLLAAGTALALRVEDIPTPRPAGWVTDQAELLTPEQEAELNALAGYLHARDGAELAIVTVRTTAGAEQRQFATDLFNHWGIGNREQDNGVLLFVAIDDRAAEIILGDGVDSDDQVGTSDVIMQDTMVPYFKAGQPDTAIVAGAQAVAQRILGLAPPAGFLSSVPPAPAASGDSSGSSDGSGGSDVDPALIGGVAGGGGLLAGLWAAVRAWLRRRPRNCDRCNAPMQRLDDQADEQHLAASERVEERLGSVDYDVWVCSGCRNVSKQRYGTFFTRYARCPQCAAVTKASAETTLVAATYDHGGRVRVDEHCEHCGYRNSSERTTPKRTRSSSSSSSGFGGGSSSGRGSSGRW